MKQYLFFATQLYCYPILRPLQQAIHAAGDEVAWYLHDIPDMLGDDDGPRLHSVDEVKRCDPCAVFVPTIWVPDFFPGVKVQVFHGFDVGKRSNTRQDHFRIRGLYDLYCTQGPNTTAPYQRLAQQHGNFAVEETGWCKLDPMFNYPTPNLLRERIGTDKPIILFSSTHSASLSAAPKLVKTIEKLSSSGRWHWLVTLHPKSETSTVDAYRALQHEHLSFFEPGSEIIPLLHAADAMLCDTSSIFLEYLLLDKPVVTFNTAMPGDYLIDVHTTDEIEPALERAMQHPPELMHNISEYVKELHPNRHGDASARILEATDRFTQHTLPTLKPRPLNLWRKLRMRRKMGYYHLR